MPKGDKKAKTNQGGEPMRRVSTVGQVISWFILIAVAVGAFVIARSTQAQEAPLGVPLPPVKQIYQVEGVELEDTSLIDNKVAEVFLEVFAPQPDGCYPLRYFFQSDRLDFTIQQPYGSETIVHDFAEFKANGIDTYVLMDFNQGYESVNYGLGERRDGESVTDYIARARHEVEQRGAEVLPNNEPLELPSYRFEHFEYVYTSDEGESASHYIYIGPFGDWVLLIDFICLPEHHEFGRRIINKVMHSFEPGETLMKLMYREDPDYGEYAARMKAREEAKAELEQSGDEEGGSGEGVD